MDEIINSVSTYVDMVDKMQKDIIKQEESSFINNFLLFRSQRQYNQAGCFILFPNKITENYDFELKIDKTPGKIYKKIKVDKNSKKSILETLSLLGITKSFIYPDRIDYVGKDMLKKIDLKNTKQIN